LAWRSPPFRSTSGSCETLPRPRTAANGRQNVLYRTNAEAIRPLHEWAGTFERFWRYQLARVKERAEEKEKMKRADRISNTRGIMISTAQSIENLTLNLTQEIHVRAAYGCDVRGTTRTDRTRE